MSDMKQVNLKLIQFGMEHGEWNVWSNVASLQEKGDYWRYTGSTSGKCGFQLLAAQE